MGEYSERGPVDFARLYGAHCFSNAVMRERLPKSVYAELLLVQEGRRELTLDIAEVVASSMRDWALERGATHYTHWFHPLSGLSAEKHESFVAPTGEGRVIMEFSGKELVKGEPDASSFPSGGLRATFEARGYTAWDATSPAFLKKAPSGTTLCVPTAFVSYFGHALDKKVPLLRSMEAVGREALRLLRALGCEDVKRVTANAGPEQEYFLVNLDLYKKRTDLVLAGRTVFGSLPAKGQEMSDHYYGVLEEKVLAFMRELNEELWTMGVPSKTQHNEVAPNQFEIAVVYTSANVAADSNQLVMETLGKVARRHGMAALLHEKPFAGVNGSGKHLNWSLATDTGVNLFEPGSDPASDARFLLFLTAVIEAVDRYAPQLRAAVATAGNDIRLGGHEAPPSIISIFLGDELAGLLDAAAEGHSCAACGGGHVEIGAASLPKLPRDLADRNRTSPLAFTGNKFEFRMVGSSQSAATPCAVFNTAVARVLSEFADRLEAAASRGDFASTLSELIAESYKAHRRVVFNGNGYSEEWRHEAARRGLPAFGSAAEAIPEFSSPSAHDLFSRHGVFSADELASRTLIYLEKYAKQVNVEAGVMIDMAARSVLPAVWLFAGDLASAAAALEARGLPCEAQKKMLGNLTELAAQAFVETQRLERELSELRRIDEARPKALAYRQRIVPLMDALRATVDSLEKITAKERWPFPGYEELLFGL